MDSKGAIYYTDLEQVWKIERNGKKHIVVPRVHTHELYMDSRDNLFGEHLWYNGESVNTWGHYVWRLSNSGILDTIKGPDEGFLEDYSFVRDSTGNMYWVERSAISRFKKKAPDGTITTIAEGRFENVRWMYSTPQGVLYFFDLTNLYKIEPRGRVTLVAKEIREKRAAFAGVGKNHMVFGIWTDKAGDIYVANFGGQVVKRVHSNGVIENVAYSKTPWAPTGGLFDDEGNLWLLEASLTNEVRVRKVPSSEIGKKKEATAVVSNYLLPGLGALVIIVLCIFVVRWIRSRARTQVV
ncbi:MAG TPA: hypothetical protein VNU93_06265 [Verrucomicrobiae bacterium]|nr:hypothetical protein [Verrucomicrobiae bacterium]